MIRRKKYEISKNRRKELEYFCRQYDEMIKELNDLKLVKSSITDGLYKSTHNKEDVTSAAAMKSFVINKKIVNIRTVASAVGEDLADILLFAVTEGISYDALYAQGKIFMCRECWYEMLKKFYYMLDKVRD